MARCEDFPCCGHYDEGGPEAGIPYCPDPETGRFRPISLPQCKNCGEYLDFDDPHFCESEPEFEQTECGEGEHDYGDKKDRTCGAFVCWNCGHHKDLVRCFCGWSASGGDGARELVEMGENLDDW